MNARDGVQSLLALRKRTRAITDAMLTSPLSFASTGLEITPLDYYHVAQSGAETRRIKVRCPLTWVLTYRDFPPTRLQELLDAKARSVEELQRFVRGYLVLHLVTTIEQGLMH